MKKRLALFLLFGLISLLFWPPKALAAANIPNPMALGYGGPNRFDPTLINTDGSVPVPNVLELTIRPDSPEFVKENVKKLTEKGVLIARHIAWTQPLNEWENAINDTLGGLMPNGFKAIAVDEINLTNYGQSEAALNNIQTIKEKYGDRVAIFVWVFHGGGEWSGRVIDKLNRYADRIMVEIYHTEDNNRPTDYFSGIVGALDGNCPGCNIRRKTVVGLATADTENWCYDCHPDKDFPKYIDAEIYYLKTHMGDLPGVAFYSYARSRPETIIWINRLMRYYYFEGKTTPFTDGNYTLNSVVNPAFENNDGWQFQPGTGGQISYKTTSEVGLHGLPSPGNKRIPRGDRLVWMKKGDAPNLVSQTVTVSPLQFYHLDIYAKKQTAPYDQLANAEVKVLDPQGNSLIIYQKKTGVKNNVAFMGDPDDPQTHFWTRFRTEFKTPAGVSRVNLVLADTYASRNEVTLWDFVELEELKLAGLAGGAGNLGNPLDVSVNQNTNFERGAYFWQENLDDGNTLHGQIATSPVKEGSKSLMAQSNQGYNFWFQYLFLQPPLTYKLSGWIYLQQGQASIILKIPTRSGGEVRIALDADTTILNQWQYLEKLIPFNWQYQNQVLLAAKTLGTPSKAYFDSLKLEVIDPNAPIIPGDFNQDGRVDILDLRYVLSNFTNIFDYNLVVGNFER